MMQKSLARLAFSFLIIAAVLAWQAYKLLSAAPPQGWTTRVVLYCVGTGVCAALGVAGIRARHRLFLAEREQVRPRE